MKYDSVQPSSFHTCLAFETTSTTPSVALWANGHLYEMSLPDNLSHTLCTHLIPAFEELAQAGGVRLCAITHIATAVGPGSFTGIRVGLATATGLMIPTPRTLFTPTTLDVVAWAAYESDPRPLLTLIDTNRGDFYGQLTNAAFELVTPPALLSADTVAQYKNTGVETVMLAPNQPLARPLFKYWYARQNDARCAPPIPLYIRAANFVKQPS